MGKFDGKYVLVTGAARGIGQATALKFASEGANLLLADLKTDWLDETKEKAEALGASVSTFEVDVQDAAAVQQAVDAALAVGGKIDVLVNNAGITKDGLLMRMSEEDWDAVLGVNLKGVFLFSRAICKIMMKQKSGSVVNVASVIGLIGNAGQTNYAASKAGVIAITRSMAKEVAERFYSVGGTTIERVLERAEAEAGGREPDIETIWTAAREAARPEFSGLAQRVTPRYQWSDLILPDKIIGQLKHLEQYLAQQETVMHHWGGQKIRPRGYGIKALFSGSPGTGKTTVTGELIAQLVASGQRVAVSSNTNEAINNLLRKVQDRLDARSSSALVVKVASSSSEKADVKALAGSRAQALQEKNLSSIPAVLGARSSLS